MQKQITVSAPGKLMLFGEYAVVYNRPCLVTAVNQRMKATVEVLDTPEFQLEALDVNVAGYKKSIHQLGGKDIPKGAKFVEIAIKNVLDIYRHSGENPPAGGDDSRISERSWTSQDDGGKIGFRVTTSSQFSSQFGFGSSSASTVCTIKAASELLDLKLSQKDIFDIAFKTVIDIQGKGSGFDVAAAVFGGTLYFVTGGEIIEPLPIDSLPLIVGYSGVKADTVQLMNQVKEKVDKFPEIIEEIYNSIEDVVLFAKNSILENDWETVGKLMNINQGFLSALGVSTKKLEDMMYGARDNGAYGAKLSGAGGGDCIISLSPEDKKQAVEQGITTSGGQVIQVQTNAAGVRVDN